MKKKNNQEQSGGRGWISVILPWITSAAQNVLKKWNGDKEKEVLPRPFCLSPGHHAKSHETPPHFHPATGWRRVQTTYEKQTTLIKAEHLPSRLQIVSALTQGIQALCFWKREGLCSIHCTTTWLWNVGSCSLHSCTSDFSHVLFKIRHSEQ